MHNCGHSGEHDGRLGQTSCAEGGPWDRKVFHRHAVYFKWKKLSFRVERNRKCSCVKFEVLTAVMSIRTV